MSQGSKDARRQHPWNLDMDDDIESISQLSCSFISRARSDTSDSGDSYSTSHSPRIADPEDLESQGLFANDDKQAAKEGKDLTEETSGSEFFMCDIDDDTVSLNLQQRDTEAETPAKCNQEENSQNVSSPRWWEPNSTSRWWERGATGSSSRWRERATASENSGRSCRSLLSFATPPPPPSLRPSRGLSRPGAYSIPGINARDGGTGEEEKEEETLGNSSSTSSTFENEYDDMLLLEATLVSEKSLIKDTEETSNELVLQAEPLKSRCTPRFVCSMIALLLVIAGAGAAAGTEWGRRKYDVELAPRTGTSSPTSTSYTDADISASSSAAFGTQTPTGTTSSFPPSRIPAASEGSAITGTAAPGFNAPPPHSITSTSTQSTSFNSTSESVILISSNSTNNELSAGDFVMSFLPEKTKAIVLEDPSSHQGKAFRWLTSDPTLEKYPPGRVMQRFALATLFYASNGEQWESSDNWLSYDVPECGWTTDALGGLLCNDEDYYEILSLNQLSLSGTLPEEIWFLSTLVSLQLYDHDLQASLPSRIAKMPRLESLLLFDLSLTGTIPAEIGLEKLKSLHLGGNALQGSIPVEIGKSKHLRNLYLGENQLTGSLPAAIGNLHDLEELVLHNNTLTSTIPASIGELTNLRLLYLAINSFSGTIPNLSPLTELRGIVLQSNLFHGNFPDLSSSTKLEYLFLGQNSLTGPLPPHVVGSLTSLKVLDVRQNGMSQEIPSEVGLLRELQVLDLFENYFSSTIPTELGLLSNAQKIMLEKNMLEGTIASTLGLLTNLERLWLHDNNLSGSVPEELCDLVRQSDLDLAVDCFKVVCDCDCNCAKSTTAPILSGNRSSPPTAWDNVVSFFQDLFN